MLQDQAKALKKRKFRQLPISKRRKLLRFSRLEILHGRQRESEAVELIVRRLKCNIRGQGVARDTSMACEADENDKYLGIQTCADDDLFRPPIAIDTQF